MSDINFHKPYKGKNDYTYKIQELYGYYYLLKEITKELHEIIKQNPEYIKIKNNNQKINLEINKLNKSVSYNQKDSNKILQKVIDKNKPKTLNIHLFNLFCARNILLKRIPILEQYINTLPVSQNNFENINQGPNNYPNFQVSKPKQKERFTTSSEKDGKKAQSKLLRGMNLGHSTFQNSKRQMQEEQNLEAYKAQQAEEEYRYLREQHEKQEKKWRGYDYYQDINNNIPPRSYKKLNHSQLGPSFPRTSFFDPF